MNGKHHVIDTLHHKDKQDTKDDTGHVQQYGKRHLSGWSDVEQQKIKPVLLSYAFLKASGS